MLRRRRNPILITAPVGSLSDLYKAIATVVYPADRPAPTNLDGLADLLREYRVRRVLCSDWNIPSEDTRRVHRMFRDVGVDLIR
ncbi:hypothetical protein QP027_08020 [Corynebacterium breve]|uniref:Uncharacterized protein n=1 Tax=Corynebacterium breve TaxID=3049799 RepID=A0ABY8VHP4_9CORY|nr:hypothetical protein [Corynebacterium breve]WIM67070.1 hypothetical protein QP027_08020 [Corynebacterium breve]